MPASQNRASSAGFSLVEILVALVIGSLAIISVLQVASLSERTKRTTTTGADAQTTGTIAYYSMARDLRVAGYGIAANCEDYVDPLTLTPGCTPGNVLTFGILAQCNTVVAHNSDRDTMVTGAPANLNYSFENSTFAPAVINPRKVDGSLIYPVGDDGSDVILVNYSGSTGYVGSSVAVKSAGSGGTTQPLAGTGAIAMEDFQVDVSSPTASRAGFHQGDAYLAVQAQGVGTCMIGEITGVPVVAGQLDECGETTNSSTNSAVGAWLNHNILQQYLSYEYNCDPLQKRRASRNVGTIVPTFGLGARLYNLGPVGAMGSKIYTVRFCATTGCALAVCDVNLFSCENPALKDNPTVWTPLAPGIVALHAQYGMDLSVPPTPPSGTVGAWVKGDAVANQPSLAAWQQLLAIRVALVGRSSQPEAPSPGQTTCDATTASPVWKKDHPAVAADISMDVSKSTPLNTDPNFWKCYRYRVIQSLEVMRNSVYGQQL